MSFTSAGLVVQRVHGVRRQAFPDRQNTGDTMKRELCLSAAHGNVLIRHSKNDSFPFFCLLVANTQM